MRDDTFPPDTALRVVPFAFFLPVLLVALVAFAPAFLVADRPDFVAPLAALAARLAPFTVFLVTLVTRLAAAAALDAARGELRASSNHPTDKIFEA